MLTLRPWSVPLQKYLDTALRLLVSLTHSDETWGRKVVECEFSMGFLIRIIFKTGQELQEAKNNVIVKSEESLKIEPDLSEDQTSLLIEHTDSQALDTLCLALGLLTNLVQSVDLAKQRIRTTRKTCISLNPQYLTKILIIRSQSILHLEEARLCQKLHLLSTFKWIGNLGRPLCPATNPKSKLCPIHRCNRGPI